MEMAFFFCERFVNDQFWELKVLKSDNPQGSK